MTVIFLNAPRFISTTMVRCNNLDEYHFSANPYTSIFLLQEGCGEAYNGEQLLSISERDLLVIHPSSEYRIRATTEICMRGFLISIDGLHFSGLPQGLLFEPHLQPILRIGEDFHKINRFFSDIHKEATAIGVGFLDLVASMLQTLLILLFRLTEHHLRSSTNSISQIVKAYIEGNYQKDLSLVDLAEIVYVSPYHLSHLFKVEIGLAPIQYLIKYRIEKAKKLLSGTKLSVQAISMQVGYPNANYFNLLFKKMTGISPGKFRKQLKPENL